jgi:hypothetical protein
MEKTMDKTYYSNADEIDKAQFRDWLKDMLHQGPVKVTFRKQNGEERVMNCTLQEGVVVPHVKTTDRVKEVNLEVCPVWDIDKGAWRSFNYESVLKVDMEL